MLDRNLLRLNPTYRYCVNKGRKEGRKEGSDDAKHKAALNMLREGFSIDKIAKVLELSEEEILNLK